LERAGFDVIEERQPSFLFERSVLITGRGRLSLDLWPLYSREIQFLGFVMSRMGASVSAQVRPGGPQEVPRDLHLAPVLGELLVEVQQRATLGTPQRQRGVPGG